MTILLLSLTDRTIGVRIRDFVNGPLIHGGGGGSKLSFPPILKKSKGNQKLNVLDIQELSFTTALRSLLFRTGKIHSALKG